MSLTADIKQAAHGLGADLVGIAPIERLAEAPERFQPAAALPEVRTLISIGVRHLEGPLLPQQRLTTNTPYQVFGYGWLSHIRINTILYETATPRPSLPPATVGCA